MISYVFGMKMEKFMEPEHSGISRVEVVKPSIFYILLTTATLKNYCTILIFSDHLIDTFYSYH